MYKKKYIKYKSKYLNLKSFIETRNRKGGENTELDDYDDDDEYGIQLPVSDQDYITEENSDDDIPKFPGYTGGSIKKSKSICKLCNNKCNKIICNKCFKTEKGNLFIEQLYGGNLSDTSMSESE